MHSLLFLALNHIFRITHIFHITILLVKALLDERPLSSVPSERDLLGNVALACPAKQITTQERIVRFDTDAKPIGVDNRCSACISPYIEDFIGPLEDTNKTINVLLALEQTIPRWAHYTGSGQMIQGRDIHLRSPICTMSHRAN